MAKGRPKGKSTKRVVSNLPLDICDYIEAEAQAVGTYISRVITRLIRDGLRVPQLEEQLANYEKRIAALERNAEIDTAMYDKLLEKFENVKNDRNRLAEKYRDYY